MPYQRSLPLVGGLLFALSFLAFTSSPAKAVILTLQDNNSVLKYNLSPGADPNLPGDLYSYTVDGVNQIGGTGTWYRIGNTTAETKVTSLQEISLVQQSPSQYTVTYQATTSQGKPYFQIQLSNDLMGGDPGSGTSVLDTVYKFTNLSGTAINNFNFFSYTNYDLNNTPNDDTATLGEIAGTVAASQEDSSGTMAVTSAEPASSTTRYEVNTPTNLLSKLNDNQPTTLLDTTSAGPGDEASAFQFVFSLKATGPKSSFQITQQQSISGVPAAVPEPSDMLGVLGFGSLLLYRLRKHKV